MPSVARYFSFLQMVQAGPEAHPATYSVVGTTVSSRKRNGQSMMLNTHFHLFAVVKSEWRYTSMPQYASVV
jgi:hypothetical protein